MNLSRNKTKGTKRKRSSTTAAATSSNNRCVQSSHFEDSQQSKPKFCYNSSTSYRVYSSLLVIVIAFLWRYELSINDQFLKFTLKSSFQKHNSHTGGDDHEEISSQSNHKIKTFLNWLERNGAIISPSLTIAPFPEFGGYGLQAKARKEENDIREDHDDNHIDKYAIHHLEEMFTIPESIIISSKSVIQQFSSDGDSKIPRFETKLMNILNQYVPQSQMVQQDVIIALYLIVQCYLDDKSKFKAYLDMLPTYIIPRLDTFNFEELEILQDDELSHLAKESKIQLQSLWNSVELQTLLSLMIKLAPENIFQLLDMGKSQCISFHSFHRFVAIVSSRAMVLQGTKYLTPLAEFANYQPRGELRRINDKLGRSFTLYHERNERDGSITVRADRDVLYGNQIFEDYGDVDNSLYLEAHGFVPNENPFHCAVIPSNLIPSMNNVPNELQRAMVALRIMPEQNNIPPPSVCIFEDGSISDSRAEAYLTLVAMDSNDNKNVDIVTNCIEALDSSDDELIQLQCLHYVNHRHYLNDLIQSLVLKSVCQSSSTLKDDLNLLDSFMEDSIDQDLTKKSLALRFRISDKMILYNVAGLDYDCDCNQLDKNALTQKRNAHDGTSLSVTTHSPVSKSEEEMTALLQKFNQYLERMDIPINKIEAKYVGDGMRIGVISKENISEGEIYFSINRSSVVDVDTALVTSDTKMNYVLEMFKQDSWDGGFDVLLVFLLYERFVSKEKSQWHDYFNLLPSVDEMKESMPLFFDENIYDYAAGSDLRSILLTNKRKAEKLFMQMSLNKDILEALGPKIVVKDNFLWAYSIIDSRSIWWNGKRHLVPLLDIVNCMEQVNDSKTITNIHRTYMDESNHVITKAPTSFRAGEQIFENYGQPNHIYFTYHGFSLENNSYDCARWTGLVINSQDKGYRNITDTRLRLSRLGFTSLNPSFCIRDGSSLHRLAQFLRIKYGLHSEEYDDSPLTENVIPFIQRHLQERLRRYTSTKRTLDHNESRFTNAIKTMIAIVEKERHYFENALKEVSQSSNSYPNSS